MKLVPVRSIGAVRVALSQNSVQQTVQTKRKSRVVYPDGLSNNAMCRWSVQLLRLCCAVVPNVLPETSCGSTYSVVLECCAGLYDIPPPPPSCANRLARGPPPGQTAPFSDATKP